MAEEQRKIPKKMLQDAAHLAANLYQPEHK
jgi:hypothetical protein